MVSSKFSQRPQVQQPPPVCKSKIPPVLPPPPPAAPVYVQSTGGAFFAGACNPVTQCEPFWSTPKALAAAPLDLEPFRWTASFNFACGEPVSGVDRVQITLVIDDIGALWQANLWLQFYLEEVLVKAQLFQKNGPGEPNPAVIGDMPWLGGDNIICPRWSPWNMTITV